MFKEPRGVPGAKPDSGTGQERGERPEMSPEQILEILRNNPESAKVALDTLKQEEAAAEQLKQEAEYARLMAEREAWEQNRQEQITGWLEDFNIEGLRAGPVRGATPRDNSEKIGIYINDEYIGSAFSSGSRFTRDEFLAEARKVIIRSGRDIKGAEGLGRLKIDVDSLAKIVMGRYGMKIEGTLLILQNDPENSPIDLYSNGENESIRFELVDEVDIKIIITEEDGRIIEYTIKNGKFDRNLRKVR